MPPTNSDHPNHDAKPVWIPVAAVFVSGLVINWLSDEIRVSPPILIALAAVALILLVAGEQNGRVVLPFDGATLQLAKLALLTLLIGSCAGAVAVIPILQVRTVSGPMGVFHNYEIGTAVVLTILASISAVRRRDTTQWLVFLAASIAGMTLSVVYLKPGNAFVPTFVGWLAASVAATAVIANGRDLPNLFLDFLGVGKSERRRGSS